MPPPSDPTPEPARALALSRVSKTYGRAVVLRGVDFEVRAGEVHCLAGENGCGKSTLIKIIAGVVQPDPGARIELGGTTYPKLRPTLTRKLGVQVIYQDLSLFPNQTVAENIAVDLLRCPGWKPLRPRLMREYAERAIQRTGAEVGLDRHVRDLPISERQIVAISRALASDARVLFLDEPTASLTHREVERLLAVVHGLKADGVATVFVSHRLREVMAIADRVTVLRDGRKIVTLGAGEMDERRLAELMTGASYTYAPLPPLAAPYEVFAVQALSRHGQFQEVSFALGAGEVLGIVGRLGAGRTELAHTLFGMTRPDAGTMTLNGQPYAPRNLREAIARGVCYLSEDRLSTGLVLDQSITNNATAAVLNKLCGPLDAVRVPQRRTLVRRLVRDFGIKVFDPALPVKTLSGGNQQRVGIAKWVAAEPKVLILDSPTVGVDVKAKDAIYGVIRALAETGLGVILISDEVDEVYYHAHRVIVMEDGRFVHTFAPTETTREQLEETVFD